jgi:hypothetical protein
MEGSVMKMGMNGYEAKPSKLKHPQLGPMEKKKVNGVILSLKG